MQYPIVIHKDPDSCYGVTVPDIPGCFSAGDTLDEAFANAVEGIECHLEGLLIDGEDLPLPQPMEKHHQNPDLFGVWGVVPIELSKLSGKSKRINISIPERLLSKIDAQAAVLSESRSSFLATAALEYISRQA